MLIFIFNTLNKFRFKRKKNPNTNKRLRHRIQDNCTERKGIKQNRGGPLNCNEGLDFHRELNQWQWSQRYATEGARDVSMFSRFQSKCNSGAEEGPAEAIMSADTKKVRQEMLHIELFFGLHACSPQMQRHSCWMGLNTKTSLLFSISICVKLSSVLPLCAK